VLKKLVKNRNQEMGDKAIGMERKVKPAAPEATGTKINFAK